jgi:hypothetical protein
MHGELVLPYQAPCKEIHIVLAGALEAGWVSASGARVIGEYIQPDTVINIRGRASTRSCGRSPTAHGSKSVTARLRSSTAPRC